MKKNVNRNEENIKEMKENVKRNEEKCKKKWRKM